MKNLEREISLEYVHASGPGGQNINKVATAVQLRFDVIRSGLLSQAAKQRMIKMGGSRITSHGTLIILARRYRTREQNREDALRRLHQLIDKALREPKLRKNTKPTIASRKKRLKVKKLRSGIKQLRAKPAEE